jgi:hypothetical protein
MTQFNSKKYNYLNSIKYFVFLVLPIVFCSPTASAPTTLENIWGVSGFMSLSLSMPSNNDSFVNNAIYTEIQNNKIFVYNSTPIDPFGSISACGGLGCDLKKADLVSIIELKPIDNQKYIVISATSFAYFMVGSSCQIIESYLPILSCLTTKNYPGISNNVKVEFYLAS